MIKDCFERQRQLKAKNSRKVVGMCLDKVELECDTLSKSHEAENVQTTFACNANEGWYHECCTHGNMVRLECGHELPLSSALCRKKVNIKSMPILSGILNGKKVSVLGDSGCNGVVV